MDQVSVLVEEDFLLERGRQLVHQVLRFFFDVELHVVLLQELFDLVVDLLINVECFCEVIESSEFLLEAPGRRALLRDEGSERCENDLVQEGANEHPEHRHHDFDPVIAPEVAVSNCGLCLESPVYCLEPGVEWRGVEDSYVVDPGVWSKVSQFGRQIEEARESVDCQTNDDGQLQHPLHARAPVQHAQQLQEELENLEDFDDLDDPEDANDAVQPLKPCKPDQLVLALITQSLGGSVLEYAAIVTTLRDQL